MKTVLYKIIDGHKIITGFDRPTVDPVETNKVVAVIIKDTPEYQAAEAKKAEYADAARDMMAAAKIRDDARYKAALLVMSAYQDELKILARDLDAVIMRLRRERAIYFEPRQGEVIRTAAEIKTLSAAIQDRPEGICIALDGSHVEDNRGKVYFRRSGSKWNRTHIVRLGDKIPAKAVLAADVTDAQRAEIERDRISALSADVKAKEKNKAMEAAIKQATEMWSRLEIQGDQDALDKSKAWYTEEVATLEALYA